MRSIFKVLLIIVAVHLCGCEAFMSVREVRNKIAQEGEGDIHIAVAWPFEAIQSNFRKGVTLAQENINNSSGVLDRQIELTFFDDKSSVTDGLAIAQSIVDNPSIMAVIGHYNSYISLPVSSVYNNGGLLMLSPASTSPDLTARGFPLVLRNIPNDHEFGRQLGKFAKLQNYHRVIIYYINNSYGRGLANAFEDKMFELGMSIVDRLPYDGGSQHEFLSALEKWSDYDYDAIFLAGTMPEAANFIATVREQNINLPIFGGDGLDNKGLLNIAGEHSEGVMVASVYNPEVKSKKNISFRQQFVERFGIEPDMWAAQGYDALMIIAEGMKAAETVLPEKVAEAIKSMDRQERVTGSYKFNQNGDIEGKEFYIKIVENGEFSNLMDLQE